MLKLEQLVTIKIVCPKALLSSISLGKFYPIMAIHDYVGRQHMLTIS